MNGICPCCEREGKLGDGCPSCPGFWFSNDPEDFKRVREMEVTTQIVPSPCKVKEYESSGVEHSVPWLKMGNYLNMLRKNPCYCLEIGFVGDNRTRFRKVWGKPHFHYNSGEFYFHCWRFKVVMDRRTEYVYVMTAKGKGTCIERTGRLNYLEDITPIDKAFADWYEKILIDNPAPTESCG